MTGRDFVAIGASSGGVEALKYLAGRLPEGLPAVVLMMVRSPERMPSRPPRILDRTGTLEALPPEEGDELRPGHVYVGPPNVHLLVEKGRVRLAHGPRENHHRPAVDPLCREPVEERGAYPWPDEVEFESKIAGLYPSVVDGGEHPGHLLGFTGPDRAGPAVRSGPVKLVSFAAGSSIPIRPSPCSTARPRPWSALSTRPSTPWRKALPWLRRPGGPLARQR